MNIVSKYIECIRKEEKPEKCENHEFPPFLLHRKKCEKIWDKCKDQVPYESSEDHISREIYAQKSEKSCIETKCCVGVKMHLRD